jgi:phosphinothricin acetyltransferase
VIRAAAAEDAEVIAAIYNHYVRDTVVTFEEEPVSTADMEVRIGQISADGLPWLVAEHDGVIQGYAYASKWKERVAYRFSVESTVYLAPGAEGRGLASALYSALFARLAECRVRAVMAGIALPNARSVALHEKFGMTKVAHFREVGFKFGQWIDVGYWEGFV